MTAQVEEPPQNDYLQGFQPKLMDWSAARIFAEKNLRISFRYPANFLIWGFLPVLWFAPFLLMANAIGGPGTSTNFAELSGFDDFLQFCVIGWFFFMYLDNSIWSIGNNFRWEQFSGTLEPLFLAPVPRISILLGAAFADTILGTIQACILLVISMFLFGVSYAAIAIAPAIIILMVMVIGLYGFGFLLAGLILIFKDPSVLTQLVSEGTYMLSPINYPIQTLPRSAQFLAYLVPTTIGVITVRHLAITGAFEPVSFLQALGGMTLLAVIFWTFGLAAFRYAENWTKKRGHMGGF